MLDTAGERKGVVPIPVLCKIKDHLCTQCQFSVLDCSQLSSIASTSPTAVTSWKRDPSGVIPAGQMEGGESRGLPLTLFLLLPLRLWFSGL